MELEFWSFGHALRIYLHVRPIWLWCLGCLDTGCFIYRFCYRLCDMSLLWYIMLDWYLAVNTWFTFGHKLL